MRIEMTATTFSITHILSQNIVYSGSVVAKLYVIDFIDISDSFAHNAATPAVALVAEENHAAAAEDDDDAYDTADEEEDDVAGSAEIVEPQEPVAASTAMARGAAQVTLWHRRLGHVSLDGIKTICRNNLCTGMHIDTPAALAQKEQHLCVACVTGKAHAAPIFKRRAPERVFRRNQLLHMDLCGPFAVTSFNKHRYFLVIVDGYSRMTFAYPLMTKDAAFAAIQHHIARAENFTGEKVSNVRTDGGGEFVNASVLEYFGLKGIIHELSAPYTPQQNGVAERINRTLLDMVRAWLHHSGANHIFWHECITSAAHVKNRLPHSAIDQRVTPYELWKRKKPDISHLRVWGCTAYALKPDHQLTKLGHRTKTCILVGFGHDEGQRAYRLYDPATRQIITSRNVTFNETSFSVNVPPAVEYPVFEPLPDPDQVEHGATVPHQARLQDEHAQWQLDDDDGDYDHVLGEGGNDDDDPLLGQDQDGQPPQAAVNAGEPPARMPTRTNRKRRKLFGIDDEDSNFARAHTRPLWHLEDDGFFAWIDKALSAIGGVQAVWLDRAFSSVDGVQVPHQPRNFDEAMRFKEWRDSADVEHRAFIESDVFSVVDQPPNRRILGTRHVFRVKVNSSGQVAKYKTRVVVQGFAQQYGIDYDEVYAPVAKFATLRVILAIAAALDYEIHQMDVCTAFLNGVLQEDVYVKIPPGFEHHGDSNKVWRLKKSMYGLKQSPRTWNQRLHHFLIKNGYTRLNSDHSVYILPSTTGDAPFLVVIAIYVDDLVIVALDLSYIARAKKMFCDEFKMTDLGAIAWLLGMSVLRDRLARTISLCQEQYARDILEAHNMSECKGIATPLDLVKLTKDMSPKTPDEVAAMAHVPYQSAIGSLMYLMLGTRPDLAAAVGILSKFASSPGQQHWVAVKRVMRYIKQTADYRLVLGGTPSGSIVLEGWIDADWAGDLDNRRSTSGYVFTVGTGATAWASKLQATVASSSTEAEYIAMAFGSREGVWERALCGELGFRQKEPTVIHEDNQGAMSLVKNPVNHSRTKHIDICHHVIRDLFENKTLNFLYCPSSEMVADVLTKALSRVPHEFCVQRLGLSSPNRA
jgi:transposase InsO family protein